MSDAKCPSAKRPFAIFPCPQCETEMQFRSRQNPHLERSPGPPELPTETEKKGKEKKKKVEKKRIHFRLGVMKKAWPIGPKRKEMKPRLHVHDIMTICDMITVEVQQAQSLI